MTDWRRTVTQHVKDIKGKGLTLEDGFFTVKEDNGILSEDSTDMNVRTKLVSNILISQIKSYCKNLIVKDETTLDVFDTLKQTCNAEEVMFKATGPTYNKKS